MLTMTSPTRSSQSTEPTAPESFQLARAALWKHATPRKVILAFGVLVTLLVGENVLDFPPGVPYMRRASGGLNFLDFGFTPANGAHAMLEKFGPAGRHVQGLLLSSVDLFIPLASGLFGSLALVAFGRAIFRVPGRWLAIAFVPVCAMLFDYAENLSIAGLLVSFPRDPAWLSELTHALTAGKFFLYQSTALLVVLGGVLALLRAVRRDESSIR